MSSFGPTGIVIDRLVDTFDKIIANLKSLWGDNIRTTPDSVIGGQTTIYSEAIANQNELVEGVVAAHQPSKAIGVFLSELVRYNGIDRNEAATSTVAVDVAANSAATTVLQDSIISDPSNPAIKFTIDNDTVLVPFEVKTISATAVDAGPVVAVAGSLTKIDTPIFGWESVTNNTNAVIGQNEETDDELRARRDRAAEQKASAGQAAIFTAVSDIQEVVDVWVHANKGGATDQYGVPGGAVWSIVEGGDDADIAQAISEHLAAGIDTFGTTTFPYNDPDVPWTENVSFSRHVQRPVYISLTITRKANYPGDGDDQITESLKTFFEDEQTLNVDVEYARLFCPITSVSEEFTITSLAIGFSPSPSGIADLPIAINQKAITDDAYIVIT